MTLSVQFLTMISMVASGFYLGMILDTFRRFTPYWKHNIFLTYFMEICFWLMQTIILFYVLFQVNSGEIRFYVFVACLLGFSIYQALAQNVYKRLLEYMIRIIASVYRFCRRVVQVLIISPITWLFTLIITIILGTVRILWKIILFITKLLITPIRWILQMIYRILPKSFQNFLKQIAGFYSKIKNILIKWAKYMNSKRR
ncbi:spore cortex biosynthesis protein YabQ [Oceanobacillus salinisoli]|uniref:spore cortex biosynthesis protein YabQ n=1 Tax=Oceanobacillus salinisoli TaxID=2678611 RepID=UPI0012E0C99B|nr:spore cortex biosynthesis protein YabQ [Oceanobacillus salinisoli]